LIGKEALSIVKRMGLICFRIAMILSTIRRFEENSLGTKLICNEDDFQVAIWLAETYFKHSIFVYDRLPRYQVNKFQFKNVRKQEFFNALPNKFQRKEAIEISEHLKIKKRTADRYLQQFLEIDFLSQSRDDPYGAYFKI